MQDSILLELKDFVENEGVYDKSAPPKFNEPYYGLYMQQKMKAMGINSGDKVTFTYMPDPSAPSNKEIYENVTVIETGTWLKFLTQGRSIWKTRENFKSAIPGRITDICITKKADNNFDVIKAANGNYRITPLSEEEKKELEDTSHRCRVEQRHEDMDKFGRLFPEYDFETCKWLILRIDSFSYYYNFASGNVTISLKDGRKLDIPNLSFKRIYPNRHYISAIRGKEPYIYIPFSTDEELLSIEYISIRFSYEYIGNSICTEQYALVYPEFDLEPEKNFYSIPIRLFFMDDYRSVADIGQHLMDNTAAGSFDTKCNLFPIKGDFDDKILADMETASFGKNFKVSTTLTEHDYLYDIFIIKETYTPVLSSYEQRYPQNKFVFKCKEEWL